MSTLKIFALFFGANVLVCLVFWLLVLAAALFLNVQMLVITAGVAAVQTYFTKRDLTKDIATIKNAVPSR